MGQKEERQFYFRLRLNLHVLFQTAFFWRLQVLSHNLCTVMRIPHDPVALEEHFKDDDEGPVSNQGYMPYLNRFILDKVAPRHTRDFKRGKLVAPQLMTSAFWLRPPRPSVMMSLPSGCLEFFCHDVIVLWKAAEL